MRAVADSRHRFFSQVQQPNRPPYVGIGRGAHYCSVATRKKTASKLRIPSSDIWLRSRGCCSVSMDAALRLCTQHEQRFCLAPAGQGLEALLARDLGIVSQDLDEVCGPSPRPSGPLVTRLQALS